MRVRVGRRRWLCVSLLAGAVAVVPLATAGVGCESNTPDDPDAGSGAGGEGGCPAAPAPQFRLTIRTAAEAPVPADTRLTVGWSGGNELFDLDDPGTWLAEGNVLCDVDKDAGPPDDLPSLVCQLWTYGATDITVTATGYQQQEQTLQPAQLDCDYKPTRDVDVALEAVPDGGR